MKYKLAFVKECKEYRHDFWYKDELKELRDICRKSNVVIVMPTSDISPIAKHADAVIEINAIVDDNATPVYMQLLKPRLPSGMDASKINYKLT